MLKTLYVFNTEQVQWKSNFVESRSNSNGKCEQNMTSLNGDHKEMTENWNKMSHAYLYDITSLRWLVSTFPPISILKETLYSE